MFHAALAITFALIPSAPAQDGVISTFEPMNWITQDDYPADAARKGERGGVIFLLDLDGSGRVAKCTITRSSGSPLLDRATCALLRRRASFALSSGDRMFRVGYYNWNPPTR